MRERALTTLAAASLLAPSALAFAHGGYFDTARSVALIAAGALLLVAGIWAAKPLPLTRPAYVALAALALLTAWTALSVSWAPLQDEAKDGAERALLYTTALAGWLLLLPSGRRLVEPLLVAGASVVCGYGLLAHSDVIHAAHSLSAGGRLEQPLTYWNAMGALAAIALVLSVRLGGSGDRSPLMRAAAVAMVPLLSATLYLTYSRGAIAAAAAGMLVLAAAAPTPRQLRALVVSGGGALAGVLAATATDGGPTALAVLAAMIATAACWRIADGGADDALALPRHTTAVVTGLVLAILLVPPLVAARGDDPASDPAFGSQAARLTSAESPRYEYWRVALNAFAEEPIAGHGAGAFSVEWLKHRPQLRAAENAHSLELQTLADLGLVGGVLLAALFSAVAVGSRHLLRDSPVVAAGPVAALVTFAVHSAIDWDWEMPALTLVAVALTSAVLITSRP